jgi:PQQ-dependent catabolism-associated CXXCW motif protein
MTGRFIVLAVLLCLAGCASPRADGGRYANATESDPIAYAAAVTPWAAPPEPYPAPALPPPEQTSAAPPDVPPAQSFADETVDDGVPPVTTIREHDFDAPTPTGIEGARTITTLELDGMMRGASPPLVIDVIRGRQTVSLPNAVWLPDAGVGRDMDDDIQAWLDLHLSRLTNRDKTRPLVFFCASHFCWLAHNAVLRAVALGYTNVSWYRGGRDAWRAAGLPLMPVSPPVT